MGERILLIRHAAHDLLGKGIAGRMAGVHLNEAGRLQARRLAERLAELPIRAVYCTPLERARETAAPLAERLGLPLEVAEGAAELDYGEWTGRRFPELEPDPRWARFNSYRSGTRIPGGECMLEVQARMVGELERLRLRHPDAWIAVVSHGDVIRAAAAHYLGVPLDLAHRIEIHPASVTVVELHDWGARVLGVNTTGELPPE